MLIYPRLIRCPNLKELSGDKKSHSTFYDQNDYIQNKLQRRNEIVVLPTMNLVKISTLWAANFAAGYGANSNQFPDVPEAALTEGEKQAIEEELKIVRPEKRLELAVVLGQVEELQELENSPKQAQNSVTKIRGLKETIGAYFETHPSLQQEAFRRSQQLTHQGRGAY
ncbi:hypothetical protein O181_006922 [Austropuccinia psidii MF-1]|uniref:Uncharacterized protein n=1 Tax=Austropuccinia psidii MF-1 TaxID=1389203 RepID=A0A9Q3BLQ3_9BASI|nr:hypothetical protein [Austropuccinia psidii MF-1]